MPDNDVETTTDAATFAEIQQLYGAQSHLIDGGHARAWAGTFTEDGVFDSASYAEPVRGSAELTAFAERFIADARARDEVMRHVLTNVFIERVDADRRSATVRAYLQILATPAGGESRLVRNTEVTDELVGDGSRWRVGRRVVRRDDVRV